MMTIESIKNFIPIYLVLKVTAGSIGCALFYTRYFVDEDTDHSLRNRLFWKAFFICVLVLGSLIIGGRLLHHEGL